MSVKRKGAGTYSAPAKRNRPSPNLQTGQPDNQAGYEIRSRVDPITGQRGAFPGLDSADGQDDMFYGPASDGLEYLRMVRAEARDVPNLLLAPGFQNISQGRRPEDAAAVIPTGFWADEAMVAAPLQDDDFEDSEDNEDDQNAQDAFYKSVVDRFRRLRLQLSRQPPESSITYNGNSGHKATEASATYNEWYRAFTRFTPTPAFIASLEQTSTMTGIERLETLLTKRNLKVPSILSNLGAWSWSLLAKCRASGELNGEEIGVLRSLAKSAQRLETKLRAPQIGPARFPEDNDEVDVEEGGTVNDVASDERRHIVDDDPGAPLTEDLEAARARLLNVVTTGPPSDADGGNEAEARMLMTLDVIVTIVGEMYGQRDLLNQRAAW